MQWTSLGMLQSLQNRSYDATDIPTTLCPTSTETVISGWESVAAEANFVIAFTFTHVLVYIHEKRVWFREEERW
jgi:hypothetical protein